VQPIFKLIVIEDPQDMGAFLEGVNMSTRGPAPLIVPYKFNAERDSLKITQENVNKITTLNITNEYAWTNAPPLSPHNSNHLNPRYDVPSLELREESIQYNPNLNNMARQLYIAGDNVVQIQKLIEAVKDQPFSSFVLYSYIANKAGITGATGLATAAAATAATTDAGGAAISQLGKKAGDFIGSNINETAGDAVTSSSEWIGQGPQEIQGLLKEGAGFAQQWTTEMFDQKPSEDYDTEVGNRVGGSPSSGVAMTGDQVENDSYAPDGQRVLGRSIGDFKGPRTPVTSTVTGQSLPMTAVQTGYDQYLAPYREIYTTKLTGWRYKIPYLENQQRTNTSQFSHTEGGPGSGIVEQAQNAMTAAGKMLAPGNYIEFAKSFIFGAGTKSYTTSFPLLNTGTQEDILRNWQFLYLLTYQNTPNRIDQVQITPPKIYEAMLPGVWWTRHAYIETMSVEFVGNRRNMTLMIPIEKKTIQNKVVSSFDAGPTGRANAFGAIPEFQLGMSKEEIDEWGWVESDDDSELVDAYITNTSEFTSTTQKVTTIIPDAYQVSITLRELVPESQNTMFAAIHKPNTVTTSSFDGAEDTGTSFLKNSGLGNVIGVPSTPGEGQGNISVNWQPGDEGGMNA